MTKKIINTTFFNFKKCEHRFNIHICISVYVRMKKKILWLLPVVWSSPSSSDRGLGSDKAKLRKEKGVCCWWSSRIDGFFFCSNLLLLLLRWSWNPSSRPRRIVWSDSMEEIRRSSSSSSNSGSSIKDRWSRCVYRSVCGENKSEGASQKELLQASLREMMMMKELTLLHIYSALFDDQR